MKSRNAFITILLLLIFASSNPHASENNIRYLTGFIKDVNNNLITFTNNLVWRADRNVTAVSMQPVVIILEDDRNEGYLYIKNEKVNVTLMQKSNTTGNNSYMPALYDGLSVYNIGQLKDITAINITESSITLDADDVYYLKSDEDKETLSKWNENIDVIVTKNGNSTRITNVVTADYINVTSKPSLATDKKAE